MQDIVVMAGEEATGTESIPLVELCVSPDKITEQLKRTGQIVLTNDDAPVALMLKIDDLTLESTLLDLRRLRLQRAQKIIKKIQDASVKNGLSNMTLEEINTEITAARAERKSSDKTR